MAQNTKQKSTNETVRRSIRPSQTDNVALFLILRPIFVDFPVALTFHDTQYTRMKLNLTLFNINIFCLASV